MDCSPPGSSIHGILQARILEWVVISVSRGSSWPRDWTADPRPFSQWQLLTIFLQSLDFGRWPEVWPNVGWWCPPTSVCHPVSLLWLDTLPGARNGKAQAQNPKEGSVGWELEGCDPPCLWGGEGAQLRRKNPSQAGYQQDLSPAVHDPPGSWLFGVWPSRLLCWLSEPCLLLADMPLEECPQPHHPRPFCVQLSWGTPASIPWALNYNR